VVRPRKARIALPPGINAVRARGKSYYYFQPNRGTGRAGVPIRIPGEPVSLDGSLNAAWWEEYRRISGEPKQLSKTGTFIALVEAYKASPEWKALSPRTRSEWERHFRFVVASWGELQVKGVEPKHVLALRDARADTPADANNLLGALSAMLAWSVPRGWRRDNPCREVTKLKKGEGYAPWPWEAIEHFEKEARRDLWHVAALALYSGQRLSDVLKIKRTDIADGQIAVRQSKTGKELWIPVHRRLAKILAEIPHNGVYLLNNTRGLPWTVMGFKASWGAELNREIMKEMRERRLVFHGLRKSAVVTLLEAGATDAEVAAITGQSREMVAHYSRQVNQRQLAAAAILKWEEADREGTMAELNNERTPKGFAKHPVNSCKTPEAGTAQDTENIGTASPARTGDPQIHNLVLYRSRSGLRMLDSRAKSHGGWSLGWPGAASLEGNPYLAWSYALGSNPALSANSRFGLARGD
jgi:integrase